jgi:hypothetical protein
LFCQRRIAKRPELVQFAHAEFKAFALLFVFPWQNQFFYMRLTKKSGALATGQANSLRAYPEFCLMHLEHIPKFYPRHRKNPGVCSQKPEQTN